MAREPGAQHNEHRSICGELLFALSAAIHHEHPLLLQYGKSACTLEGTSKRDVRMVCGAQVLSSDFV
jgi:hypothetical protein